MKELFIAVLSGVISGYLLQILTEKNIIPILRGRKNNVPDISGIWIGYDINEKGEEIRKSNLTINQIGINIEAVVNRDSNEGKRNFKYEGFFLSDQVVLNFEEEKGECFNIGAMVLHLDNITTLKGKSTYFHHGDNLNKVIAVDKIYKKMKK